MPAKRGPNGRFLPRDGSEPAPQTGGRRSSWSADQPKRRRRRVPPTHQDSDYASQAQPRRRQTAQQEKTSNEHRAMQEFLDEMNRRDKPPVEKKKPQYGKAPKPPRTRAPPPSRRRKVPPDHSDSEDSFAAPIRGQGKHFGANRGNAPMKSPGMRGAGDAVEPSPLAIQDGAAAGNVLNPVPRPFEGALQAPQRLMVDDITIIHQ